MNDCKILNASEPLIKIGEFYWKFIDGNENALRNYNCYYYGNFKFVEGCGEAWKYQKRTSYHTATRGFFQFLNDSDNFSLKHGLKTESWAGGFLCPECFFLIFKDKVAKGDAAVIRTLISLGGEDA